MRIALVNPNTNGETTRAMRALAQAEAGTRATVHGLTAASGAPLICDEGALAQAADAVAALAPALAQSAPQGVIVAAFGDPGREQLARVLPCPVVGIAEAGMAEAARDGRRFMVVTTTPDLVASITRMAHGYGFGTQFLGVQLTPGDPRVLMADARGLEQALLDACAAALDVSAEAIVIGGGPLATAARAIAHRLPVPVIEPVPAAVRLLLARIAAVLGTPEDTR